MQVSGTLNFLFFLLITFIFLFAHLPQGKTMAGAGSCYFTIENSNLMCPTHTHLVGVLGRRVFGSWRNFRFGGSTDGSRPVQLAQPDLENQHINMSCATETEKQREPDKQSSQNPGILSLDTSKPNNCKFSQTKLTA